MQRDSISLNLLTESAARFTVYVSGIVSSSILYRAINGSYGSLWTEADYAYVRIMTSWHAIFLAVVLFGLSTAVIKTVSQYSHNRDAVGSIILATLPIITLMFGLVAVVTVVFPGSWFLVDSDPAAQLEMRLLWPILLVSLAPSVLMRLMSSAFSGLQRMKRNLAVEIVYNGSRIAVLLGLFLLNLITITNVLYTFLLSTAAGCVVALAIFRSEAKREGLRLTRRFWPEISRPLLHLAAVFVVLMLVNEFFTAATTVLVSIFGSTEDVARFSISQNLVISVRALLYAPFAVLLPNLAGLYSRGGLPETKKRFDESNRIILPTLVFSAIVMITFGEAMIGTIFGLKGIATTGGASAYEFLAILSVSVIVIPIAGIYSNMLTALGEIRLLLGVGIFSVVVQSIWIILMQPVYGVIVIAFSWVGALPVPFVYHYYCGKKLHLTIERTTLARGLIVGIIFIPVSYLAWLTAVGVSQALAFWIPIFASTTVSSIFRLAFIVPLWYVFIGLTMAARLMTIEDVGNLKRVLRKIPPAWWVSKPILELITRWAGHHEEGRDREKPPALDEQDTGGDIPLEDTSDL